MTVFVVAERAWTSGKPVFGFPLFHGRSAGAVGMWESRAVGEIPKGRWEGWETCLWFSTLSTVPAFPQLPLFRVLPARSHFILRHLVNNASLAFCICCAASVSLIRLDCRSSSAAVIPSFKYFSQFGSETNFSYGVR